MNNIEMWHGDCLDLMKNIPDNSIDMILADLPYKKGMGSWDYQIDLEKLWFEYKRISKKNIAIVLFSQNPFSAKLIMSNPDMYKYNWIWDKGKAGNIFTVKLSPMIYHEDILVFSNGTIATGSKRNMKYYPQMELLEKPVKYTMGKLKNAFERKNSIVGYKKEKTHNFPKSIIYYYNSNIKNKVHPTQKPVGLLEYLIKTYSLDGEIVLDNTMGSGSTIIACKNTNRRAIGIEKDKKYFDIAVKRLNES